MWEKELGEKLDRTMENKSQSKLTLLSLGNDESWVVVVGAEGNIIENLIHIRQWAQV